MRLVVVTGLSGSGKTAALKALEDLGFFCVDNLPVALLPKFLQLSVLSGEVVNKVGIGMDSRGPAFFDKYREAFDEVERLGIHTEVLFVDAAEEVLLRRFSETRRRHPLSQEISLGDAIIKERALFDDIRQAADLVIDTTRMSVHDLKKTVWNYFKQAPDDHTLNVSLMSFGFRHGLPQQADIVLDVRFLPNPYFVAELKHGVGTDPAVRDYVFSGDEGNAFLEKLADMLDYLIPLYEKEGKSYLTVAIGCTGGHHRSVAMVEALATRIGCEARPVRVHHRDVEK